MTVPIARNVTVNLSGIVAYTDNTVESFGVWYDSASKATLVSSATAFRSVAVSKAAVIAALKTALLPATVAWTPPTVADNVRSMTLVLSGNVSYLDNTIGVFAYEIRDTDVVYNHFSNGFDDAVHDSAVKDIIDEVLETALNVAYPSVVTPVTVTAS